MPWTNRMFGAIATAAAAASLAASPAAAQTGGLDPQCAQAGLGSALEDACQKSVDVFNLMAPQLGTAIAGGNAILGQRGTFGKPGRFTIGVRVTAFNGRLPNVQDAAPSTSGAQRSNYTTTEQYLGAPAVDGAVGLFGGVKLGPVRVGAVDALASATYIPEYAGSDVSVTTPNGSLQVGYGARVGLVQETSLLPGVAVTYLRRDLPEVDILGLVAASGAERNDTLGVRGLNVKTDAWRVVAGKRLLILGVAAGFGQDRYSSGGRLGAVVNENVAGFPTTRWEAQQVTLQQSLVRTSYFADASLNLPFLKVTGEVGRVLGGSVRESYNSFDGGATRGDDPRTYYAVGLRLGF